MRGFLLLFALLLVPNVQPAWGARSTYKIVTGGLTGTYVKIGRDLAQFVAEDAGFDLVVQTSAGSLENVERLRFEKGVKFAIVQNDVFQRYKYYAERGSLEARIMIQNLRVVLPLYNEEVHMVVRADSDIKYFHQIRGKIVNMGPRKSGTAMTVEVMYNTMYGSGPRPRDITNYKIPVALRKLVNTRDVDVVAYVAGQPTSLFKKIYDKDTSRFRFLRADPNHPTYEKLKGVYYASTIRTQSYPRYLSADVPTFAVKAFLITYNYRSEARKELGAFGRSLCRNIAKLRNEGHPKWKEVKLPPAPLPEGWDYYDVTKSSVVSCDPTAPAVGVEPCDTVGRALGLCK